MNIRFHYTLHLQASPLPTLPYWQGEVVAEGILNFLYDNHPNLSLQEPPSNYLEEQHYWEALHDVYYHIHEHCTEILPFLENLHTTRKAIQTILDDNQELLANLATIPAINHINVIRLYESSLLIVVSGVR